MVSFSFFFMRDIIHKHLVNNARSVYSFALTQLESDLHEPRMMLKGFSQTVRAMLLRGDSVDSLQKYVNDITNYLNSSGSRILSSMVMFGYFETFDEPVLITSGFRPPPDYIPQEQPWYHKAVENRDKIMETSVYNSILSGAAVITYARCINDEDGNFLGIIGLNINIEDIGRNVVEISLAQGGYGILIDQSLTIIAHTNSEFVGLNVSDTDIPFSIFAGEFGAGQDIIKQRLVNWKGENTAAFFWKISNGWYLGLLTPEGPFFQDLKNMAIILVVLGAIFSVVLIGILIRIDMARNKSERDNRHKSAFLANMSHEIRTPMNAIIGMTSIGKSSSDIERKNRCFTKIEDASNHLLGVINDILDMSKIEANKFELSSSEFCFEKMFQRAVNVVNFRMDEKHQKFTVHIDPVIPKILIGDDQRIVQVITNLLGNAVKFTPEKGSIYLGAQFVEEHDGICNIRISVSDTGIGITKEQQERVFCSFEQAESSTTRKYGGTGLGLAISKSIVDLMGGSIWVDSEPGYGSTFTFILPLERCVQQYQGLFSPNVHLNNVRIMVIDDDPEILSYFKEISREFNIKCDTAISGEQAIGLVEQKGHYHIYFVDWKMPGMDGIQLIEELKAYQVSIKSVVIMLASSEWSVIENEAEKAGIDKFLSKPLFPSNIADAINAVMGVNGKDMEESQVDISGLFKGRHLLLAEDVEINREIIMTLLEPTQIEIDYAENGKEAVRMFSESPQKYDMIFMDVQMPEMDGYEATRSIRALDLEEAHNVRIIAMTANVFREDIEKCLEAGMDNHVGKPLDFDDVINKLRHYLPVN